MGEPPRHTANRKLKNLALAESQRLEESHVNLAEIYISTICMRAMHQKSKRFPTPKHSGMDILHVTDLNQTKNLFSARDEDEDGVA